MILIACVDDNFGMCFNNRRVSKDIALIEDICKMIRENNLFITPFSSELFKDNPNVYVLEESSEIVLNDEYFFIEDCSALALENQIEKIVLYFWNRNYPADLFFDISLTNWQLESETEFKGNSHEKITKKIYTRGRVKGDLDDNV